MDRIKDFVKTSLLGGLIIAFPVAILLFIFKWIFTLVTDLIQPLTDLVMARSHLQEILADLLGLIIILTLCFIVGIAVKTKLGRFIYEKLENRILKVLPGYSLIKETIVQFLGKEKLSFSSVALVKIFENDTLMTAFVTDTHSDGSYTVFIPTGPNPTSGNIYHLKREYVYHLDIPVEDAMRSIISCGAGSTKMIRAYQENCRNKK